MLLKTLRREPSRRTSERGSSAVEAALVTPLFVLLIFGTLEIGSYFFSVNGLRAATRDAAREASAWAASPLADYNALLRARRGLTGSQRRIEGVVIFKAQTLSDGVPPACVTALRNAQPGVPNVCNVYTRAQLATIDPTMFGASATPPDPSFADGNWPATLRNDTLSPTVEPDIVGVYVEIKHSGITGIVPTPKLRATRVVRIEPQRSTQ